MEEIFKSEKWGYRESTVITVALFLIGVLLQFAIPTIEIEKLKFPFSLAIALIFVNAIVLSYFGLKHARLIQWLASVPAAISSISLLGILTLAMGFIPQTNDASNNLLGIHNLLNTWYFIFAIVFFLITLGFVSLKRLVPFKWKNIGFILNHFGLWLAVFAGIIGNADITDVSISLQENRTSWIAFDKKKTPIQLPFTLKLLDFSMEEYAAKPLLIKPSNSKTETTIQAFIPNAKNDSLFALEGLQIKVQKRLMTAVFRKNTFVEFDTIGSCQAFLVSVYDTQQDTNYTGWISNGSNNEQPNMLTVSNNRTIALSTAEAKKFSSNVVITNINKEIDTVTIEVNKPYNMGLWSIYQYDYDTQKGRWSDVSVLQIVHDPWLILVYIGLAMVILGSIYLLFTRGSSNDNSKQSEQ
ncbi:MAG: cytochrome c biogenesis protein ResB [Bacteroidales bacterium]|nr:cytochrome c biogenesis protein ResB [Bacteroidales bacterium]